MLKIFKLQNLKRWENFIIIEVLNLEDYLTSNKDYFTYVYNIHICKYKYITHT